MDDSILIVDIYSVFQDGSTDVLNRTLCRLGFKTDSVKLKEDIFNKNKHINCEGQHKCRKGYILKELQFQKYHYLIKNIFHSEINFKTKSKYQYTEQFLCLYGHHSKFNY